MTKFFTFLILGSLVLNPMAFVLPTFAFESQKNQKPNVIFILADDLGYGDLGIYGQKKIKTPNIDKLAMEGMRFSQFYAGSTVCAPSRSVLMTGKHLGRTSVRGNSPRASINNQALRKTDKTIADEFKQAGYSTALFGKWGLGEVSSEGHPNDQGFDTFFGFLNQHHAHNFFTSFLWKNKEKVKLNNVPEVEDPERGDGWARIKNEYAPDRIMSEGMKWLDQNHKKPFFLYLASTLPHANNEAARATGDGQEIPDYGIYKDEPWTNPNKGQAAMITRLDSQVGELMAKLKRLKIDKNTIVIFTSDNGAHDEGNNDPEFFNASGVLRSTKRALYEGGIRVPFIVKWDGVIKPNTVSNHIGYFGDMYSTISELTGQKQPDELDSLSIVPTLKGKTAEQKQHKYLYWEFYEQGGRQGVRFGDWKAIREPMFTGKVQLFNLKNDISETKDIAKEYPDRVAEAVKFMTEAHTEDPIWKVRTVTADTSATNKTYGSLKTRWAKEVTRDKIPLNEYPRPQMVRNNWTNLNGVWNFAVMPANGGGPDHFAQRILVPFAPESQLSGLQTTVGTENKAWYNRNFETPNLANGERLILNFGAVDWHATVWLNGKRVGEHKGGHDSFSFDVTDFLTKEKKQYLTVSVFDPTSDEMIPVGKQRQKPGGIFYQSVTGIWQTVWLEKVGKTHIKRMKITPNVDDSSVKVEFDLSGGDGEISLEAFDGEKSVAAGKSTKSTGELPYSATLKIPNQKLWSPQNPFLYDLKISVKSNGKTTDEVKSYFGMRKISLMKDSAGITRMALNNEPIFQLGFLDQGWFPDGLYTAPTDAALRYDIEYTKQIGFNTARKHVKVEPARWYYWADKLGLLVWQDMPSTTAAKNVKAGQAADMQFKPADAENYKNELKEMMDDFHNYPSIVVWTVFNEGWGQHDTKTLLPWAKNYDPSRLQNGPSGWGDRGFGDMVDIHRYPGASMPAAPDGRARVLSEYGGVWNKIDPKNMWKPEQDFGNRSIENVTSKDNLRKEFRRLTDELKVLRHAGLSAAIYTQTTDVEIEINGLLTYDREVSKIDIADLQKMNAELFEPLKPISPRAILAENSPEGWKYSLEEPAETWNKNEFDDSAWKTGNAPFGDAENPYYKNIKTPWKTNKLWLRKKFNVEDSNVENFLLKIFNNDAAEIFLNGVRIRREGGWTPDYRYSVLNDEAKKALRKGENVIAIAMTQDRHSHIFDLGLYDFRAK